MMKNLPHLAAKLFNVPLALRPEKAEVVMAALADHFGVARLFSGGTTINLTHGGARAFIDQADTQPGRNVGYDVCAGVAVVPISGTLVQKLGSMRPYSGMTGYDTIRLNLLSALADAQVKAVMLDIDSPGGEVAGCFDLCDTIYAARQIKPVWAVLNESAFSAAYAIASSATRITVPRTGGTGSIGVICMHTELSRALDKAGIAVTMIRFGAHKAEANGVEPLSDAARAKIQAEVDAMGELFVATVARNRGLTQAKVRDTEAGCFTGQAGVDLGLADAVMPPDAAFRDLVSRL